MCDIEMLLGKQDFLENEFNTAVNIEQAENWREN